MVAVLVLFFGAFFLITSTKAKAAHNEGIFTVSQISLSEMILEADENCYRDFEKNISFYWVLSVDDEKVYIKLPFYVRPYSGNEISILSFNYFLDGEIYELIYDDGNVKTSSSFIASAGVPYSIEISEPELVFDNDTMVEAVSDIQVTVFDFNDIDITDLYLSGNDDAKIEIIDYEYIESAYVRNFDDGVGTSTIREAIVFINSEEKELNFRLGYWYKKGTDEEIYIEGNSKVSITLAEPYAIDLSKSFAWGIYPEVGTLKNEFFINNLASKGSNPYSGVDYVPEDVSSGFYPADGFITIYPNDKSDTIVQYTDILKFNSFGNICGMQDSMFVAFGDEKENPLYLNVLITDNRGCAALNRDYRDKYEISFLTCDPDTLFVSEYTGQIVANKAGTTPVIVFATDKRSGEKGAICVLYVKIYPERQANNLTIIGSSMAELADSRIEKYSKTTMTFSAYDQYGQRYTKGVWKVENATEKVDTRTMRDTWKNVYEKGMAIPKDYFATDALGNEHGPMWESTLKNDQIQFSFIAKESANLGGYKEYTFDIYCDDVKTSVIIVSRNPDPVRNYNVVLDSSEYDDINLSIYKDFDGVYHYETPSIRFYLGKLQEYCLFDALSFGGILEGDPKNFKVESTDSDFLQLKQNPYLIKVYKDDLDVTKELYDEGKLVFTDEYGINSAVDLLLGGTINKTITTDFKVLGLLKADEMPEPSNVTIVDCENYKPVGDYQIVAYKLKENTRSTGSVLTVSSSGFLSNELYYNVSDSMAEQFNIYYAGRKNKNEILVDENFRNVIKECFKFKMAGKDFELRNDDLFDVKTNVLGDTVYVEYIDFYIYVGMAGSEKVYYKSRCYVNNTLIVKN